MKKLLSILLLLSLNCYSQMYNNKYYNKENYLSIVLNTSVQLKQQSVGLQIRGDFTTWYASIHFEKLKHDNDHLIKTGFSIGKIWSDNNFYYLSGIRFNTIRIDNYLKPSFGLESEINKYITNDIFIGAGVDYNIYWNSPNYYTEVRKYIFRGLIKIGVNI